MPSIEVLRSVRDRTGRLPRLCEPRNDREISGFRRGDVGICSYIHIFSLVRIHFSHEGMGMGEDKLQMPHKLILNERRQLTMTGVTEVISFDENAVVLCTELGRMTVHGRELQLRQLALDGGQVAVDGNISAIVYEENRQTGGWLRRLTT